MGEFLNCSLNSWFFRSKILKFQFFLIVWPNFQIVIFLIFFTSGIGQRENKILVEITKFCIGCGRKLSIGFFSHQIGLFWAHTRKPKTWKILKKNTKTDKNNLVKNFGNPLDPIFIEKVCVFLLFPCSFDYFKLFYPGRYTFYPVRWANPIFRRWAIKHVQVQNEIFVPLPIF